MKPSDDQGARHALALCVIALFILGFFQVIPARPGSVHNGWSLWGDVAYACNDAVHGGPTELFRDATACITGILVLVASPFFLTTLGRSPALLFTARFLSGGSFVLILISLASSRQTCELDGIRGMVLPLLLTTLGLLRLRFRKPSAMSVAS